VVSLWHRRSLAAQLGLFKSAALSDPEGMSSSRLAPTIEGYLAIETFTESLYLQVTHRMALPDPATIAAERAERLRLNPEDVLARIQPGDQEKVTFVFVYAKHGCRPAARTLQSHGS